MRGMDLRWDGAGAPAAVPARRAGVCAGGDVLCGVDVFSAAAVGIAFPGGRENPVRFSQPATRL